MGELVKADNLCGVRFWAQWRPIGVIPAYEVYEYIGAFPDIGAYVFRAYKNPQKQISKGLGQLNVNGFKPFCYNMGAIAESAIVKGLV